MNRWTTKLTGLAGIKPQSIKIQIAAGSSNAVFSCTRNKRFRFRPRALTGVALLLLTSGLNASGLSTINAYIGFAKTLKSAIDGFIGTTTVTPAVALGRWDHWDYGIYGLGGNGKPNFFGRHFECGATYTTVSSATPHSFEISKPANGMTRTKR